MDLESNKLIYVFYCCIFLIYSQRALGMILWVALHLDGSLFDRPGSRSSGLISTSQSIVVDSFFDLELWVLCLLGFVNPLGGRGIARTVT